MSNTNPQIVQSTETVSNLVGPDGKQPVNTEQDPIGEKEVRKIPGLSSYDPKTGKVLPRKGFGGLTIPDEMVDKPEEKPNSNEPSRHEKFKQEQKAKREEKEQAKLDKALKNQGLVKELLYKGDILGAAKALGMTAQEFVAASQNAALTIPTKKEEEKPLSPEEKKALEREQLIASLQAKTEENERFRRSTVARDFIRENIDPIIADKEAFEFIHQGDVEKIKYAVYEYMDKRYNETCTFNKEENRFNNDGEIISPKLILETIEKGYEEAVVASLEKNKSIKKISKYFNKQEEEVPVKEGTPDVRNTNMSPYQMAKAEQEAETLQKQLQDRAKDEKPKNVHIVDGTHRSASKPFALMTKDEKVEYFKHNNN